MHPGGRSRAKLVPLLSLLPALVAACASTRPLRPIEPGSWALSGSVGGPLVDVGPVVPTPMLMLGAARGLGRRHWSATLDLGVTAALYGNLHVAPGVVHHLIVQPDGAGWRPSVAVGGSLHVVSDLGDILVAPQVSTVASWLVRGRHVLYGGADLAVPIGSPTRVITGPLLGAELRRGAMGFGLEAKWLAPYHDVEPLAPSWVSPGHHGYLSLLLSFNYRRSP